MIAQEAELTTAYKRIFEYKKRYLNHEDKEALGAISLSFEITADLIFIETDDLKLINRLSCLRPRAYICVFSDLPHVTSLTALNFGVYTFPKYYRKNPEEFVATVGKGFLFENRSEVVILQLETNQKSSIINHRVTRFTK